MRILFSAASCQVSGLHPTPDRASHPRRTRRTWAACCQPASCAAPPARRAKRGSIQSCSMSTAPSSTTPYREDDIRRQEAVRRSRAYRESREEFMTLQHRVARSARHLIATAIAALALSLVPAQAADPIKIGLSLSLTGATAPAGRQVQTGLEIWRDHVNARGGLLGRPVELVYYDDQANPANAPGIDRSCRRSREWRRRKKRQSVCGLRTSRLSPVFRVVVDG